MRIYTLAENSPVVVHLQNPKEKLWGILVSVTTAGIVVRGLDLVAFEEWLLQMARHEEPLLGPTTIFYPMHRVERMERDETVGPVVSFSERFQREVGRPVEEVVGLFDPASTE